jgi:hypothetical protein
MSILVGVLSFQINHHGPLPGLQPEPPLTEVHGEPRLFQLSVSFWGVQYHVIYLSIYLPTYLSTYLSIYLCVYLSIYRSIYPSIHLSIDAFVYLSIDPSMYVSIYLSIYLSINQSIERYQEIQKVHIPCELGILAPTFLQIPCAWWIFAQNSANSTGKTRPKPT